MIPVVAACIRGHKGKYLLSQRPNGNLKGKWEIPGGQIKDNETPIEALKREIREELNCRISVLYPIHTQINTYGNDKYLIIYFACYLTYEEPKKGKVTWVTPYTLHKYDCLDGTKEAINHFRRIVGV